MSPERGKRGKGRPLRSSEISLDACPELERESGVPLYYQLAANLFEALEVERPKAGAPFPTERELEQRFSVSRAVVRDALRLLAGDGEIIRVRGQGAFVAPKRRQLRPQGLISLAAAGHDRLSLQILNARIQIPRSTVARQLGLKRSSKVAWVIALLHLDDEPVGLIDSHSSPALSAFVLSAADYLQGKGSPAPKAERLELTKVSVRIEQNCLGPWGGPKLGASAGDPALMAHLVQFGRAGHTRDERPLEYAHLICPSSSVQLVADLR